MEKDAQFSNCTGGAARFVDITLFGSDHIYQRPTAQVIYDTTVPFDPEGLIYLLFAFEMYHCFYSNLLFNCFSTTGMLGSLTCVLCSFLGAEAAKVLLIFPANNQRISRWLTWSLLTVGYPHFSIFEELFCIHLPLFIHFFTGTCWRHSLLLQN